jgi:hypothetical protein
MRARNIKPAFFTNEALGVLDPIIQLTFAGLWCLADRDGILEDRPLRIKAELFPYRDNLDVNGYLTVLERTGFIQRYEVNGVRYIEVLAFTKHQSPHHTEKAKGYPANPLKGKDNGESRLDNGEITVPTRSDSLIPDSLIPDSLIPDIGATKKADATPTATPPPSPKKGTRLPDDWQPSDDLLSWAKQKRPDLNLADTALLFCNYWQAKAGKDACKLDWGKTFKNWVLSQKAAQFVRPEVRPAPTRPAPETSEQLAKRKAYEADAWKRQLADFGVVA